MIKELTVLELLKENFPDDDLENISIVNDIGYKNYLNKKIIIKLDDEDDDKNYKFNLTHSDRKIISLADYYSQYPEIIGLYHSLPLNINTTHYNYSLSYSIDTDIQLFKNKVFNKSEKINDMSLIFIKQKKKTWLNLLEIELNNYLYKQKYSFFDLFKKDYIKPEFIHLDTNDLEIHGKDVDLDYLNTYVEYVDKFAEGGYSCIHDGSSIVINDFKPFVIFDKKHKLIYTSVFIGTTRCIYQCSENGKNKYQIIIFPM